MIRSEHAGTVTTVILSRPPVNAIDPEFVSALHAVLDEIDRRAPTMVVIRSDQKCFCAGADLALIRGFFAPGGTPRMVAYVETLHVLFNRLAALAAVTLAVIDGPALGGGLVVSATNMAAGLFVNRRPPGPPPPPWSGPPPRPGPPPGKGDVIDI